MDSVEGPRILREHRGATSKHRASPGRNSRHGVRTAGRYQGSGIHADPRGPSACAHLGNMGAEMIKVGQARVAVLVIEETMKTKTQWMEIFDRQGVPASPVNFAEDLPDDPQVI
jgi:hypothetical protein